MAKPVLDDLTKEAFMRLRVSSEGKLVSQYIKGLLEHQKDRLVSEVDPSNYRLTQGYARCLKELDDLIWAAK